jgi:hypothetical protein
VKTPERFRVRNAIIEALQWTGTNVSEVRAFAGSFHRIDPVDRDNLDDPEWTGSLLETNHSTWQGLRTGDWVVRYTSGLIGGVRADDFAKEYEPAPTIEHEHPPIDYFDMTCEGCLREQYLVHTKPGTRDRAWLMFVELRRTVGQLPASEAGEIMGKVTAFVEEWDDLDLRNAGVTMTEAEAARRRVESGRG